jgi:hypothetical protein
MEQLLRKVKFCYETFLNLQEQLSKLMSEKIDQGSWWCNEDRCVDISFTPYQIVVKIYHCGGEIIKTDIVSVMNILKDVTGRIDIIELKRLLEK